MKQEDYKTIELIIDDAKTLTRKAGMKTLEAITLATIGALPLEARDYLEEKYSDYLPEGYLSRKAGLYNAIAETIAIPTMTYLSTDSIGLSAITGVIGGILEFIFRDEGRADHPIMGSPIIGIPYHTVKSFYLCGKQVKDKIHDITEKIMDYIQKKQQEAKDITGG